MPDTGRHRNQPNTPVAHWETELSYVKEDIARIEAGMDGLRHTMIRFETTLSGIASEISQSHKPQWSAMAGWAGVILTVGALVWSNLTAQVAELKTIQDHLRESDQVALKERVRNSTIIELLVLKSHPVPLLPTSNPKPLLPENKL